MEDTLTKDNTTSNNTSNSSKPEPHNFPLVHLNLYTKINCCCYTHTDVSSAKIFCMDFIAENKNIYNLHGWQLGVINKTRSEFAAYNRDKIIN